MGESRDNHYVPQWYQEGFFEPGEKEYAYLDLTPDQHTLPDGRIITQRDRFFSPTSRCFRQTDLYSTFFGTAVNDEIERFLFGTIDASGAAAVRAFSGADVDAWIRHFAPLFKFLDIQKLRTPKGLAWLRTQYPPPLSQNELMREMQGVQFLHATVWQQAVREIVSAEDSDVKFVISDHPVTIYNPSLPPNAPECAFPHDPSIALKGSQTVFPLNRNFCLILTNLEYARDPAVNPIEKRTFARSYQPFMAFAPAFIRTRKLSADGVRDINFVTSARAYRYLAGGRPEWLTPAPPNAQAWKAVAGTLLPPKDEVWNFGREVLAKMRDGRVFYQDEYGRREPEHAQMFNVDAANPRRGDPCGCGSNRPFRECCQNIPVHLRPSWTQVSVRERNLGLFRAAVDIFDLNSGRNWTEIRTAITDEKIRKFHEIYASLWPIETDLLSLLPKPDGRPRAVYTGAIHPKAIIDFAIGTGLYFGEVLIEHPLTHPRIVHPDYSPLDHPQAYRGEILKALSLLWNVMPLVELGVVNLIPDPCTFDGHLREQLRQMARDRNEDRQLTVQSTDRIRQLVEEDARRTMLMMPERALLRSMQRAARELGDAAIPTDDVRQAITLLKKQDPLAVLQSEALPAGEAGAQLTMMKLSPNFEMVMYLAQATGACIVTDSPHRWRELLEAMARRGVVPNSGLPDLARAITQTSFAFPQNPHDVFTFAVNRTFAPYTALFGDIISYLRVVGSRGRRPNYEAQLLARMARARGVQREVAMSGVRVRQGRILAALPNTGIRDNTVNRLLLMSSAEHHWSSAPMALYVEPIAEEPR